jgi:hypothetical protein
MSVIDFHNTVGSRCRVKLVVLKPTNRLGRKEPNDDHYRSRFPPRVSANSFGRYRNRRVSGKRLGHREDAERFYRALAGQKVRVGMEASGHARWFERLVAELQLSCG